MQLENYRPITSTPFLKSGNYCEIPPCAALKPYIRCFWGNNTSLETSERLVIPDTCMDIIIKSNRSDKTLTASFCTLDEKNYLSHNSRADIFGVRFYCHSAVLFSTESFRDTKNRVYFPDDFFRGITSELTDIFFRFNTLPERAKAVEKLLLRRLNLNRMNFDVMNVINDMIKYNCRTKISEIARRNALSQRRTERIFAENIGVSPKTLSNLIRYQLVWQEIARGGANILDMTEKYGYTDQAHLLNDFRSHHGMTPTQAFQNAMSDFYNTDR